MRKLNMNELGIRCYGWTRTFGKALSSCMSWIADNCLDAPHLT